jgi:hypothetical protein
MDSFRLRLLSEWSAKGYKFFEETVWSSSIQKADLPKVNNLLKTNGFDNVDVSLINPPDDKTCRMRWNRHYETSGQCVSVMHQIPIPAHSNHLKLTFAYISEEARQEHRNQIIVAANVLRLVFGVPIARELIFDTKFSDKKLDVGISSDVGYASPFDTQNLNMFEAPPIEEATLIAIPEEAAILLDKAFAQPFPDERFILMWLAFEAVMHSHPGRAENGKKREKYFREELKSVIVNQEVFRLFQLRNDVFKEGRFSNPQIDQECWNVYAVLQLAIMKDCPQRTAFLAGFENTLQQRAPSDEHLSQ